MEGIPIYTRKEGVSLDFLSPASSKAQFGRSKEAGEIPSDLSDNSGISGKGTDRRSKSFNESEIGTPEVKRRLLYGRRYIRHISTKTEVLTRWLIIFRYVCRMSLAKNGAAP